MMSIRLFVLRFVQVKFHLQSQYFERKNQFYFFLHITEIISDKLKSYQLYKQLNTGDVKYASKIQSVDIRVEHAPNFFNFLIIY